MSNTIDPVSIMGTVGYMSPEQAQGRIDEIDQRSDVFSFGCILFEAVTGHRAFEGKDAIDSLNKIIREPAPPITTFVLTCQIICNELCAGAWRKIAKIVTKRSRTSLSNYENCVASLRGRHRYDCAACKKRNDRPNPGRKPSIRNGRANQIGRWPTSPPASSAEYIVTGIKQHKLAVVIVLACC